MTLEILIGRWKTEGWTRSDPPDRIDAVDTYEWLPGGAVLHPSAMTPTGAAGHREAIDENSNWRPWMDITLTREAG
jgi:hypothetical protein